MQVIEQVWRVLPDAWQSTRWVQEAVAAQGAGVPAISDVAAALRQLRREGQAERQRVGDHGHVWRRATTPEAT